MPLDTQAAASDCCERWKGLQGIQTMFTTDRGGGRDREEKCRRETVIMAVGIIIGVTKRDENQKNRVQEMIRGRG